MIQIGAAVPESVTEEQCVDSANGATDSGGDGCSWYDEQPASDLPTDCLQYDDDDFVAREMCCSCKQAFQELTENCENTNNGLTDGYGDGCDEYTDNPNWCGYFDDDKFKSMEMCCICGGGNRTEQEPEVEMVVRASPVLFDNG